MGLALQRQSGAWVGSYSLDPLIFP
jgi:hypothetical protein